MHRHARAPLLFIAVGVLFIAAAIRDLFFPTLLSRGDGQPALSASIGVFFIIVGLAQRGRLGM